MPGRKWITKRTKGWGFIWVDIEEARRQVLRVRVGFGRRSLTSYGRSAQWPCEDRNGHRSWEGPRVVKLEGPVVLLMDTGISQDNDRNSFGEDFEPGAKVGFMDRKDSSEQAWGRELVSLVWSSCGPTGSWLTCSPKTRSLNPKGNSLHDCGALQSKTGRRNALQTLLSKGTRPWGTGK